MRFPGETPPPWQLCLACAQRILKYVYIFNNVAVCTQCLDVPCFPVLWIVSHLLWVFPSCCSCCRWEQAEVLCGNCWDLPWGLSVIHGQGSLLILQPCAGNSLALLSPLESCSLCCSSQMSPTVPIYCHGLTNTFLILPLPGVMNLSIP